MGFSKVGRLTILRPLHASKAIGEAIGELRLRWLSFSRPSRIGHRACRLHADAQKRNTIEENEVRAEEKLDRRLLVRFLPSERASHAGVRNSGTGSFFLWRLGIVCSESSRMRLVNCPLV